MSNYDASIRIDTKINTKSAEVQLERLENQILKSTDKIKELRSKMDSLKDQKVPTQEYKEVSVQIEKAEQKFNKLLEKQELMQREGKDHGVVWDRLSDQIDEVGNEIRYAQGELQDLVDTGKAFTLGQDTEQFSKLGQQLQYAENNLSALNKQHKVLEQKVKKTQGGYAKLGDAAKKSFNSVGSVLKKVDSRVNSFGKRLKEIAHRILPTFHKETKRSNTVLGQFSSRLKSLLSGMFIFNALSAGFRKLFSGVGESFQAFYNYSNSFQRSVDGMRSSLAQLKNSIAAAFAPIVQAAVPYIQKLIAYITKAVNSVAQLIAALMGKKTYTRALKTNVGSLKDTSNAAKDTSKSVKDTSSALDGVADSADQAKDALEGYLNPLDEINKYHTKEIEETDVSIKAPDLKDDIEDIGDEIGDALETVFEEIPIEEYWNNLAEKLKNILSQFFAPIKEAWSREGKFVMDSWKYALKEIWDLIKSIGSDFLEVWQQEKTIKIFEDLLHIIGDIGLVSGNLAHNFREAWEQNETGKRILEGIRDILGVIVANIRHAADVTVEWSKDLDFSLLLAKIQNWIESLVPVFDNLSGIITDFYEKVLLPLGKWTLEKGLPELLQVFIDFNNKVDWEALRERLAQFWEHLEPFAETVGEGLIIFIERCANALADFINSPAFDKFLTTIENWMDSVKPEDVADALEAIAKTVISLKVAVAGFSAASKGITMLSKLADVLKLFGAGGGISSALGGLKTIGTTIAGWAPHVAVGVAIVDVINKIKEAVSERIDTNGFGIADWISETLKLALEGWKQEFENWKISLELWWQDTWLSNAIWNFEQWWNEKVKPWFRQEKWSELWEGIKTAFSTKWGELVDWWNSSTLVTWWEESVMPWFTVEKWSELFENIKQSLMGKWNEVIDWWNNTAVVGWWNDNVVPWFTAEKWSGLYENIKRALVDKWNEIVNWWSNTAIAGWWKEHVAPWFTAKKWLELYENIKISLKEVWDNTVGQWSSDISAWWDEHVAPWFTKKRWEDILSNIPEAFSNGFAKVVDAVKEKIQPLIDWVIEKVEWMKSKIEDVREKFNSIKSQSRSFIGIGAGSILAGGSIFGKSSSRSLYQNPVIASLSKIDIPAYATGQVIPRTMKQHLAILGDNSRETEVVSPLSTMKEALKQALIEMGGVSRENSQPIILKVILDGKDILYAMVKEGKIVQMSTGKNIFALE